MKATKTTKTRKPAKAPSASESAPLPAVENQRQPWFPVPPFYVCTALKAHTTKGGVVLTPGGVALLPKATIRGEHLLAQGIIAEDPHKVES